MAVDNFVHYPFVYFPVFYVFKQSLQGGDGPFDPGKIIQDAATKYKQNGIEDNVKMWLLWVPGDIIVYSVPIWLRLPLNHGLSFIWICYLSFLRGDKIEQPDKDLRVKPDHELLRTTTWNPASRQV